MKTEMQEKTRSFSRKKRTPEDTPLCYRCDHRAKARETGHGPRCECSDEGAVVSCYMYRPVQPLVLEANAGEDRDISWPAMLCGRAHASGLMPGECVERAREDGSVMRWWVPTTTEDK